MVRTLEARFIDGDAKLCKFAGLSTDDKPVFRLATGSEFLEVDTGDVYAFDEVGGTWAKIKAGVPADTPAESP